MMAPSCSLCNREKLRALIQEWVSNPPSAQAADVCHAQVAAIVSLVEIIGEPYTGHPYADYNLRRNKCEAARVLLSLKTRMLKDIAWKP
jgi:hypothetical protein